MKLTGKIKFWNEKKGYGFIENGDKQDIFVDGWDLKGWVETSARRALRIRGGTS